LRVAVLKGGRSLERAVSLRSGAQVQDALERLRHDVVAIDVGEDLVPLLKEAAPDVVFIALHGRDGEDGTVQELLEALDIPYTGSGPSACIRCTDKVLAKHLLREAALPTPDFYSFKEHTIKEWDVAGALPDVERKLGFPMVVKPASQGSALGVKFARSSDELPSAILGALSYDRKVLLERYVRGRDLAVSVLEAPADTSSGRPRGADSERRLQALPVVEAVPTEKDFYDFEARYEIGRTRFVCPAELPAALAARARDLALRSYRLLGCEGFARIDLMLAQDDDEMYVLEANVVPGLTETSLLPQAADAAGIDFDELVERLLATALVRRERLGAPA
jgi:D-alanine-D-alanine ligase